MLRFFCVFLLIPFFACEVVASSSLVSVVSSETPDSMATGVAEQSTPSIFSVFFKRVRDTWNLGEYDLYFPVYTWHNRFLYDSDKAAQYNENPWGGGVGRSMLDEDGDAHLLFLMGFQDSHNMFEPYGGYAFQKNWYFDENRNWSAGVGYVLGITARQQYHYIPFPLPLPIAGVQYKRLAVQAAYILGGHNNGNVLFLWLRWHMDFSNKNSP